MKPTPRLRSLLAALGGSAIAVSSAAAQATSNTWDTDSAGDWTDVTKWTGDAAYAEGADNTATFGDSRSDVHPITPVGAHQTFDRKL